MTVRDILKMGDPRLLRVAEPVSAFDTPELHGLIADMQDTMVAVNGAGLAAPQIGVNLQLVIFGSTSTSTSINPRYPGRPLVPRTVPARNEWPPSSHCSAVIGASLTGDTSVSSSSGGGSQ